MATTVRAAIAVVDSPVVGISYTLPVSQIVYVDLTLGVVLDTRGFFKLLAYSVGVTDKLVYTAQKLLRDAASVADRPRLEPRKRVFDSVGVVDEITRTLVYLRNFSHTVSPTDGASFALAKLLPIEYVVAGSDVYLDYTKFIADGFAMNDSADLGDGSTYSFSKGISNVVGVSALIGKTPQKVAKDTTTAGDSAPIFAIGKVAKDTVSLVEFRPFEFTKPIGDTQPIADTPAISFSTSFSDGYVVQDSTLWSFSASKVEYVPVSDSGLLWSQNYCDPTYFAEDYVGVSQSF